MRAVLFAAVVVLVAGSRNVGHAQQVKTNVTSINSTATLHPTTPAAPEPGSFQLSVTPPKDTNSFAVPISKETRLRVSGPLVQPFKAKTPGGFFGRVAHWVNPFSKDEPNVPPAPSGPMNTRAWTTIAGWSPGHSAYPSGGAWDEPIHLDLLSVSTEKQR